LAAGAVYKVVVRATLPASAPAGAGPYSETLTATSNTDPTKSNTVINTLTTITANTVDLTNNSPFNAITPAPGQGSGTATVITTNTITPSALIATQSRFQLYVNNTSAVADSYNLSVTGIPSGWAVTFAADGGGGSCATTGAALTNTGTLAANANRLVCAIVNVPATNSSNAAAGNYDLTFRAQSAVTATSFDTKVDRVTVNALHSVTLTPNGTQQTFPGGAVTYTHVLKNSGNVNETITFPSGFLSDSQVAAGWTSVLYIDSNGSGALDVGTDTQVTTSSTLSLAINASQTLFVRVFAPASATAASAADITTVTATYNAGASTASASDTTSVTDGLLLQKGQAAVGCTAPGPFIYSAAAIAAGANTAPGQCISYQISATNTTAANITTVVLSDNIPANTTRNDACGAPTATGSATVAGTSANATGGTVTASLPTLASTASFALTFCVKINP
jgi:trimeric autotransporter adhesin